MLTNERKLAINPTYRHVTPLAEPSADVNVDGEVVKDPDFEQITNGDVDQKWGDLSD